MLFFDDKKYNQNVESLGVVMYLLESGRYGGLRLADIDAGVQQWRMRHDRTRREGGQEEEGQEEEGQEEEFQEEEGQIKAGQVSQACAIM